MWSYKQGKWLTIIQLDVRPDFDYDPGTGERVFSCWIYGTLKLRVEQYPGMNGGKPTIYICDHSDFHAYSVPDILYKICEWWIKEPGWGGMSFHEYVNGLVKPPIRLKDRGKSTQNTTTPR